MWWIRGHMVQANWVEMLTVHLYYSRFCPLTAENVQSMKHNYLKTRVELNNSAENKMIH